MSATVSPFLIGDSSCQTRLSGSWLRVKSVAGLVLKVQGMEGGGLSQRHLLQIGFMEGTALNQQSRHR